MGFLGWRFPPRRFNAGLCLARQFIAGVTGFHPSPGFQPQISAPKLPTPAFQRWVMFNPAIHCRDYGIPPSLRGFNLRHRHQNGAKHVKSENFFPDRFVFERKWVTCASKRPERVSFQLKYSLRSQRKRHFN